MKVTKEMIAEGLGALAKAQQAGASCTLSETEMERMPDQILEARVSRVLAEQLGLQLQSLAIHHEILERSHFQLEDGTNNITTEFVARVVLMKPDDYNLLCRLLRLLIRETWSHDT